MAFSKTGLKIVRNYPIVDTVFGVATPAKEQLVEFGYTAAKAETIATDMKLITQVTPATVFKFESTTTPLVPKEVPSVAAKTGSINAQMLKTALLDSFIDNAAKIHSVHWSTESINQLCLEKVSLTSAYFDSGKSYETAVKLLLPQMNTIVRDLRSFISEVRASPQLGGAHSSMSDSNLPLGRNPEVEDMKAVLVALGVDKGYEALFKDSKRFQAGLSAFSAHVTDQRRLLRINMIEYGGMLCRTQVSRSSIYCTHRSQAIWQHHSIVPLSLHGHQLAFTDYVKVDPRECGQLIGSSLRKFTVTCCNLLERHLMMGEAADIYQHCPSIKMTKAQAQEMVLLPNGLYISSRPSVLAHDTEASSTEFAVSSAAYSFLLQALPTQLAGDGLVFMGTEGDERFKEVDEEEEEFEIADEKDGEKDDGAVEDEGDFEEDMPEGFKWLYRSALALGGSAASLAVFLGSKKCFRSLKWNSNGVNDHCRDGVGGDQGQELTSFRKGTGYASCRTPFLSTSSRIGEINRILPAQVENMSRALSVSTALALASGGCQLPRSDPAPSCLANTLANKRAAYEDGRDRYQQALRGMSHQQ